MRNTFSARLGSYHELAKPGIAFLSVITTLTGFYLGSTSKIDMVLLFHALLGTGIAAGGSGALNHLLERKADTEMDRTKDRPIPSGRLGARDALLFGTILTVTGVAYLSILVNPLTGVLCAATVITYLFVYTPLKRVTHFATTLGAIPGAIPALMGWTAAGNELAPEAFILFFILFLWQIPHFLSIAWMYREDYARGGFPVLPVADPTGRTTGLQIVLYDLALVPASLAPAIFGLAGVIYFVGALVVSLIFFYYGLAMALDRSDSRARRLLFASIAYVPLVLVLLMADRIILS